MSKLHVVLVCAEYPPEIGGIATHLAELAAALAATPGVKVTVATTSRLPKDAQDPVGRVSVRRFRIPRGRPMYTWALRPRLSRLVRREGVDVVHVHGMRPLEATRGLPVPVVYTNHTSGYLKRLQGASSRRLRGLRGRLVHCAAVLAPSQELADGVSVLGYEGPVRFLPNGVDTAKFQPQGPSARRGYGIAEHETVVLLARRLATKNGVLDFAHAMAWVKCDAVRILVAGDGAHRAEMERVLYAQGHARRPLFVGAVPNHEMPSVYRAADIVALPSHMEATSITGLEAMATAIPIVGTRVGGIPTLVEHGVTGLLVEPRRPQAFGEAVGRLVESAETRGTMGAAARRRAEAEFAWDSIVQSTIEAYRGAGA